MKRNGGWRISSAENMRTRHCREQTADGVHRREKVSTHEEGLVHTVKLTSLKPICPVLHLDTRHMDMENLFLLRSLLLPVLSIALYQICRLCPRATSSSLVT
jgi:hypothetical protein